MATSKRDFVELRGLCPTHLASAIDAIAMSEGMSRNDYVVKVLGEEANRVLHRTSVIQRALKGNPLLADTPLGTSTNKS